MWSANVSVNFSKGTNSALAYAPERASQNLPPRSELPLRSRRGEKVQMPQTFGMTMSRPPPTPLLHGKPIEKAKLPLSSYIPAETMMERASRTVLLEKMRSFVTGHMPPFARLPAIVAIDSASCMIEQHLRGGRGVSQCT